MQALQRHARAEDALPRALERGVRFLERAATVDGRWLDFRFRFVGRQRDVISSQWVTAYVGHALARAGGDPTLLERARQWLLTHAHPGGGWGFSLATPADADSIANVVAFLARMRTEPLAEPLHDTALTEACRQLLLYWDEAEAGFRTYRPAERPALDGWASHPGSSWCDVHSCVTALAAQALHAVGEPGHTSLLEACARRMRERQAAEGFWEAYWWQGRTYATFHSTRFLHLRAGAASPVDRALRWVEDTQGADGGWGNGTGGSTAPFHTALALATLLLEPHRASPSALAAGLEWLLRSQQPDGGWASTPIMRMPRPEHHAPWTDPEGCLLLPVLTDLNRLFTTATVLSTLADCRDALSSPANP